MDLSFLILTWNSEKFIANCLDSILSTVDSKQVQYEIHVVDNHSLDKTRKVLDSYATKLPKVFQIEYLDRNQGTTISRNIALRKVKGEFVMILDSDVTLKPGAISRLLQELKSDTHIGVVAPKLIYPNGRVQKSTDKFPTVVSKFSRFFFLKKMESNLKVSNYQTTDVDYAISAVWLFKKDLLNEIGLLDENIFYAPEDADYCLSCWKNGYRVVYVPDAVAVHDAQEISRGLSIDSSKLSHIKGLWYFFRKHRFLFSAPQFSQSI